MNSINSLERHNGQLTIDHRANGDPIPGFQGMGKFVEVKTIGCRHCGGAWVVNPFRTRTREYCRFCNRYICDGCAAVAKRPGYIHRTIDDLTEMIQSGNYEIVGGTVCDPHIIRKGISPFIALDPGVKNG